MGLGLYVLVALLWGVVESRSRQVLRDRIRDEGIFYASHLESELNFRMVSLRRMIHRWQMRGGTPRDEFMADAESYVKDFAGFRALAWVDKGFIIRWAIPREWEGEVANRYLAFDSHRRLTLEKARDRRAMAMTPPLDLVWGGGRGFLMAFPLEARGAFDGFILAVVRYDDWLGKLFEVNDNHMVPGHILARVLVDGVPVYRQEGWEDLGDPAWGAEEPLDFEGYRFVVQVRPTPSFFEAHRSAVPRVVGLSGALMATLMALIVLLLQNLFSSEQHLHKAKVALEEEIRHKEEAQKTLQGTLSRLDLATQAGGIGVWSCGRESHFLSWNDQMYDLFGLPIGSPLSCDGWLHMINSEDRAFLEAFLEGAARSGEAFQMEVRVMTPEGIRRHLGLAARMARSEPQGEGTFIGVCWDLTALKETELSLRRQGSAMKFLAEVSSRCIDLPLEELPGAIQSALGRMGVLVGARRAYVMGLGDYPGAAPFVYEWCAEDEPCDLRGFPLEDLSSWVAVHCREDRAFAVDVASLPPGEMRCHLEGRGCGGLLVVPMFYGEEPRGVVGFESLLPWKNLSDQDGALFGLFAQIVVNARRRIQAEERIRHLATHDFLTDLPKLPLARDRLTMALGAARRYRHRVAVMFIDLDGFKAVNDTFGHDAGDEVLRHVARSLRSGLRETDTAARVGGDEFLLVIPELQVPDYAIIVAEKVLRALKAPIPVPGGTARVGASIGIALYPDHGSNDESLIKAADDAMYREKFAKKGGYQFATPLSSSGDGEKGSERPPRGER